MHLSRALLSIAGCALSAVVALPASAATFQVTSGTRGATVSSYDPIGQSFSAMYSDLTAFGFQFQALSTTPANGSLTFTLYAGEGFGGTALVTRTFTVPDAAVASRTPTWFDIDITGTTVTVGSTYTAALVSNGTTRPAVTFGPNVNQFTHQPTTGDAYAGGRLISTGDPDADNLCTTRDICDLNFRVTGTTATAPVPEPTGWALLIAGFGAVGRAMRRRPRQLAAI